MNILTVRYNLGVGVLQEARLFGSISVTLFTEQSPVEKHTYPSNYLPALSTSNPLFQDLYLFSCIMHVDKFPHKGTF